MRWAPGLLVLAAGCATRHPPPALSAYTGSPLASWARVLDLYVDGEGRVDFAALAEAPRPLEHVVAWIAVAGPGTEPDLVADPDAKLACYVNAYNALAMYNVLESGTVPADLLGFFVLQKYRIGGRYMNLYDFENKVIRRLGEPRVHFALNCMSRSCPRLPREPFEAAGLAARLDEAAREFLNDDRRVHVDADGRTVRMSEIMRFYEKDFLAEAPTLIDYVNRYRDEPIPAGLRVVFDDFDWTLNAAPGGPVAAAPGANRSTASAEMSSDGLPSRMHSLASRPVTGPSVKPMRAWPVATNTPAGPGAQPTTGSPSAVQGRRPHHSETVCVCPMPSRY